MSDYIFETEDENIVYIPGVPRRLDEVNVKINGNQWAFHKSDPDKKWPSNPHGDSKYTKLNPYDGSIWDKTTKKQIATLSKKQLARLQAELKAHKDFSYLVF